LHGLIKQRLTDDLNVLHRRNQWDNVKKIQLEHGIHNDLMPGPANRSKSALPNPAEVYQQHPLLLGPGFRPDDLKLDAVNRIGYRSCGLCLTAINAPGASFRIFGNRMMRTFRAKVEFGKSTDTGFIDGKVVERVRNPYLQRYKIEKALSSIQSSHQKSAFTMANVSSLQSQEAYELAVKGPVRPSHHLGTHNLFVYGIRCVAYEHPHLELEFNTFVDNENEVFSLIAELGVKLKAGSVCTQLRCIRYGYYDLSHALLEKHVGLESVIGNIYALKKVSRDKGYRVDVKKAKNFVLAPESTTDEQTFDDDVLLEK
jgi:hypothetical protein